VPAAYWVPSNFEVMKDPETSGVPVGFFVGIFGVIGTNATGRGWCARARKRAAPLRFAPTVTAPPRNAFCHRSRNAG
jgi:hypothetical protein